MRLFLFSASLSIASFSALAEDVETCAAKVRADFAGEISGLEPMQIRDKAIELEKKLQDCGVELTNTYKRSEATVVSVQPKAPLSSNGQAPITTQPYFGPVNQDDNAYIPPIVPSPGIGTNPILIDANKQSSRLSAPAGAAPQKNELKLCIDAAVKVRQEARTVQIAIDDRQKRNDAKHANNDQRRNSILACIQDFQTKQQAWRDARNAAGGDHPITTQPINLNEPPPGAYKIQPYGTPTGDIQPVKYQPVSYTESND